MKTTSEYGATLIEYMGSDLTVVNAARVSFDKESDWAEVRTNVTAHLPAPVGWMKLPDEFDLKPEDAKLIAYLARNGHWSPFAHPQLSFRVKAPLFVARQLGKHQVGLAWNEVSRRYVDAEPEFYIPTEWRKRAENVKQGSSSETVDVEEAFDNGVWKPFMPEGAMSIAVGTYNSLLQSGVCPEQARMVLPQSMMTEWVWTGSLYAFARVCQQRLDPHAQLECRWVAEDIAQALAQHFPASWQVLMKDLQTA